MTARATFKQSDLDRAVKAAAKVGYEVSIYHGVIRLLPIAHNSDVPSAPDQADEDWDKALGLK